MSKNCAICGTKMGFNADYSLSKDYKNIKICFVCYEYAATCMKGNRRAAEILQGRYTVDIDPKIAKYINSFNVDIQSKKNNKNKDGFMDLLGNDLSQVQTEKASKKTNKQNIFRLNKLSEAKKDRLIRIKIASKIMAFIFVFFGLLLSFYLFTQGYGSMISAVTAIFSIGFSIIFIFIINLISIILNE